MGNINKKIVLPCLRGVLGDWVYYSSLMSAKQIAERIKPAKEICEAKQLDELLQRELSARKKAIASYLLSNKTRFFNSLVVGVFDCIPDWIPFDISKKTNEIAPAEDIRYLNDSMGLLVFKGDEKMFAIDGQHRVAGIEIAVEKFIGENENIEGFEDDQYSIIFVAHIDDVDGRRRTRRLFSDINKNAKAGSWGKYCSGYEEREED